jgi:hypothetical protein
MDVQEAKQKLQSIGLIVKVFEGERRIFGGTTTTEVEPHLIENSFAISRENGDWEITVSCLGKKPEIVFFSDLGEAVLYVINYYKDWEKAYNTE